MFPSQAEAATNNGLVGYWSFNEGTSTIATDFSGRGNHGTLNTFADPPTASSGWTFGKRGKALQFDGSSDRVSIPDNTSLHSGDGTISMWVKSTTDVGASIYSAMKGDSTLPGWTIEVGPSTGTLTDELVTVFSEDGTYAVGYTTSDRNELFDGQWHHVVVTADTTTKIYIDGVAKTTSTGYGSDSGEFTSAAGIDSFRIGNSRYNSSENLFFTGALDEVRMYNRALTATEVAELYRAGVALHKPANNLGLIGYWSFNEATSTVATDFSGNGNHGTLQNFSNPMTSTSGWVAGKRGSALAFGGVSSDDRVNAGDINATDGASALTISAWIYDRNTTAGIAVVSKYAGATPGWDFYTSDTVDCGGNDMTFSVDGSDGECTSGNVHEANRWEHWVVVYNGGQVDDDDDIKFYLNGVLQTDARQAGNDPVPDTTNSTSNVVSIGADSDLAAEFEGFIDEVRIYNRALSASEVASLYGAGATRIGASSVTLAQGTSLSSGLVGHWTFDGGDMSWQGGTEGTIYDRSVSVNHLSSSGVMQQTAVAIGKLGQAFNFDGVDDYVACWDGDCGAELDMGTGNWTVAAWVKPDSVTNSGLVVSKQDFFGGANPAGWNMSINASGRLSGAIRDDGDEQISTNDGTVMSVGVWQHIAVTFNRSGNMTRYLNGVQTGTADSITLVAGPVDNGNQFRIGARDVTGDELWYDGLIDDVRVYNRALTATEVKQLYHLGQGVIRQ